MGYMKDLAIKANSANDAVRECAAALEGLDAADALDRADLEALVYNLGAVLANRDDTEDLTMAAYGLAACAYMSDIGIYMNDLPEAIEYVRNMLNNMNDEG